MTRMSDKKMIEMVCRGTMSRSGAQSCWLFISADHVTKTNQPNRISQDGIITQTLATVDQTYNSLHKSGSSIMFLNVLMFWKYILRIQTAFVVLKHI